VLDSEPEIECNVCLKPLSLSEFPTGSTSPIYGNFARRRCKKCSVFVGTAAQKKIAKREREARKAEEQLQKEQKKIAKEEKRKLAEAEAVAKQLRREEKARLKAIAEAERLANPSKYSPNQRQDFCPKIIRCGGCGDLSAYKCHRSKCPMQYTKN
jgi:hypothetical protein